MRNILLSVLLIAENVHEAVRDLATNGVLSAGKDGVDSQRSCN